MQVRGKERINLSLSLLFSSLFPFTLKKRLAQGSEKRGDRGKGTTNPSALSRVILFLPHYPQKRLMAQGRRGEEMFKEKWREGKYQLLCSLPCWLFSSPFPHINACPKFTEKLYACNVENLCTRKSTFRHRHFSVIEKTVKLQNSFSLGFIKCSVNPGSRDNKNKKIRVDKTICKQEIIEL